MPVRMAGPFSSEPFVPQTCVNAAAMLNQIQQVRTTAEVLRLYPAQNANMSERVLPHSKLKSVISETRLVDVPQCIPIIRMQIESDRARRLIPLSKGAA
jgi:hypothetical protein